MEDRRNVGEKSYNSGDGTDQRVQSLMYMLLLMMMMIFRITFQIWCNDVHNMEILFLTERAKLTELWNIECLLLRSGREAICKLV